MPSRQLIFRVRDEEELKRLIEALQDVQRKVKGVTLVLTSKLNEVRATFLGDPFEVQEAVREAKRVFSEMRSEGKRDKEGYFLLPLGSLARANLKVAIPLQLLSELMRLMGYDTHVEGNYIRSKASPSTVLDVARRLSEAYSASRAYPLTSSSRRLVTLYSTLKRRGLDEAIRELKEGGLLIERRDGSLVLSKNFNMALEILKRDIKGVQDGTEGDREGKG